MNNTAMASALSKTGMSMQTTATWVGRMKDDGMSGGETAKSGWGQDGKAGFLEEFPLKKYYLDKDLKCKLELFLGRDKQEASLSCPGRGQSISN